MPHVARVARLSQVLGDCLRGRAALDERQHPSLRLGVDQLAVERFVHLYAYGSPVASLSFKQQFIEPIQKGAKQTTLRGSRPYFLQGETVDARCRWTDPPFAQLHIEEIELVQLDALTDRDAHNDGFESAAALRETLELLYPGRAELWLIRFRNVESG